MTLEPSPQFADSLNVALNYWHQQAVDGAVAQLDRERHNIQRAIEFGLALPETQPAAMEVTLDTFKLIYAQGYWREWLPVLEEAVAICPPEQPALKMRLLGRYGQLQRLNGLLTASAETHREELALALDLGQPRAIGLAYARLARSEMELRLDEQAELNARFALEKLSELDRDALSVRADVFSILSRIMRRKGLFQQAINYLEQAIANWREIDLPIFIAGGLFDLGSVYEQAGQYEAALVCYDAALTTLEKHDHPSTRLLIQYGKGALLFDQQRWTDAESMFRDIDLSFLQQTGNLVYEATILISLGNALLYQRRFDEATIYLRRGVAKWRRLDYKLELANAIGSMGEALAGKGEGENAREKFVEALCLLADLAQNPRVIRLTTLFQNELDKLGSEERSA